MFATELLERLRTSLLLESLGSSPQSYRMLEPNTAEYEDKGSGVVVCVDIRLGLVSVVTARGPFRGKSPDGIKIGMPVPDAIRLDPTLTHNEIYGVLEGTRHPGLFFELDDPDPLPGDISGLTITGLGVHDPDFFRTIENGQLGVQDIEDLRQLMLAKRAQIKG